MTRGLALTDWLVSKTSTVLGDRMSRRGFIAKTTMVGTAVAASGCAVITQQGAPYTRLTDCRPGSLCRDGYTEFCCVINNGVNACPPGSIASGWWRADYSVYCNGTRYYIDCNDFDGGGPCRCGSGCDTRKVYCNHFRYGQCNTWIGGTGVIACRMVTCVPPYALDLGCGYSGAVDNATAGHYTDCAPYTPPPPPPPPPPPAVAPSVGDVTLTAAGAPWVFVRNGGGGVSTRSYTAPTWAPFIAIGGAVESRVESRVTATTPGVGLVSVFYRGADAALWTIPFDGSSWTAPESLGGLLTSDPVAVVHATGQWVFVRGGDSNIYYRRNTGSGWGAGFTRLATAQSTSDPAVVGDAAGVHLFWRGNDRSVWTAVFDGVSWSGPESLGGLVQSDLAVASNADGVFCVVRGDQALYAQRFASGSWQGFVQLPGPAATSDPCVVANAAGVHLFWRAPDNSYWYSRFDGTQWVGTMSLGGGLTSDPAAVADGSDLWLFGRGFDNALYVQHFDGSVWSGWQSLGGYVTSVRGATSP